MSVLGLQSGLGASIPLLISYHFPLILGINYGLGLGVGIGLSLYFWTVMLIQDKQKMLIQEHVLLGKITVTVLIHLTLESKLKKTACVKAKSRHESMCLIGYDEIRAVKPWLHLGWRNRLYCIFRPQRTATSAHRTGASLSVIDKKGCPWTWEGTWQNESHSQVELSEWASVTGWGALARPPISELAAPAEEQAFLVVYATRLSFGGWGPDVTGPGQISFHLWVTCLRDASWSSVKT